VFGRNKESKKMEKLLEKFEHPQLETFCTKILGSHPPDEFFKHKILKKMVIKNKDRVLYIKFIKKNAKYRIIVDFALKRKIVDSDFVNSLE